MAEPTETPAATLRRAAALMREEHGPDHARHAFWHALAGWLDATAARAERTGALAQHALSPGPLAVALAYLGEQDGAR